MEYLKSFILTNIYLIVISAIMLFIAIYNFKQQRRMSTCIIIITALVGTLAILETFQNVAEDNGNLFATTFIGFLGYVLRPICLIFFILLSKGHPKEKKWILLFSIPFAVNLLVYLMMFIPGAKQVVVYYTANESGGISFNGGPLRFTSHILSGLYLGFFVYVSLLKLKLKHIGNGVIILICAALIVFCVLVETFFNDKGEIHLLNTGIMISVMFYYLFLYIESAKYDPLTSLFNRSSYYQDVEKMEKSATAIIQFDMNGLKYLNDNFGHEEGDVALQTIAEIIANRCNKDMYPYRLGGDEFIVIVNSLKEEEVIKKIERIKEDLSKTNYSCSIGYAYRTNKEDSLERLSKVAEQAMYFDKNEFYRNSKFDRRSS